MTAEAAASEDELAADTPAAADTSACDMLTDLMGQGLFLLAKSIIGFPGPCLTPVVQVEKQVQMSDGMYINIGKGIQKKILAAKSIYNISIMKQ
jgi:hypothetical protein